MTTHRALAVAVASPDAHPNGEHERTPLLPKLTFEPNPPHPSHFKPARKVDWTDEDNDENDGANQTSIHKLVHDIRLRLLELIDTPLSTEQLTSPRITLSITRPLELEYFNLRHEAIVFALLVNRVQFITDSTHALTLHSVNATRASLCEILATNVLRRVHESDLMKETNYVANSQNRVTPLTVTQKLTPEEEENCLLKSANVLATAFAMFQGAPAEVIKNMEADWGAKDAKKILSSQCNALEMAIVSEAKQFIRSPACQRVIEAIWTGKIVYSSTAIFDILSDRYKRRPVSLYNPRNAPLLNHYRLGVPRNRAALEYFHYGILIASYVATMQTRELNRMNGYEIWFNIFTLGFALDKLGSILEHGWRVFIANLWNGFDAAFILSFLVYLGLRTAGLFYVAHYDVKSYWLNEQSHQILSCLAIIVFPRLAFITLSDNILILSLRSMLSDFVFLMLLGAWCFLGFLYSLYMLQQSLTEAGSIEKYSLGQIAKWMVYIFFGLDSTGISIAHEFHRVLGPAIFIIYACLSNTLLVTVLVSILSKIFSDISNDAIAETLYRKAVLTFEGVKSDAIFSFQPPFNMPALLILIILKPFLTPRKFHTVVVFLCRSFGCPVLLAISFFERYVVGPFDKGENKVTHSLKLSVVNSLGGLGIASHFIPNPPRHTSGSSRRKTKMSKMSSRISRNLQKFGGLAVINACFDYEPDPPSHNTEDAQQAEDTLIVLRRRVSEGGHTIRGNDDKKPSRNQWDYVSSDRYSTLKGPIASASGNQHSKRSEGGELEAGLNSRRRHSKRSCSQSGARLTHEVQESPASSNQKQLTPLERLFLPEGFHTLPGKLGRPPEIITSQADGDRSCSSSQSSVSSSDTSHTQSIARPGRKTAHKSLSPYSSPTLGAPYDAIRRSMSTSSVTSVHNLRTIPRSTRPASIIQNEHDELAELEHRGGAHHVDNSIDHSSIVNELEERLARSNEYRDRKINQLVESQTRIENLLKEFLKASKVP
ncbi:hypothetical protein CROQUDRAFT_72833 [Cronartium quercuum f. sp. fusiforme G11]|uniref:Uncharacterized protein n=1 Tax=Cronartium quercuum f. sp. fusiforme G11 TaxID=708437 RepID=A0A9P6TFM7_9BASI|nr:hypothetical protein CROQUDRAFT_72833 [Cronartium quercuum f. sp. fusiforme G11]